MATQTVKVEVAKETHEVAVEARAFVSDVKAALSDSWDPLTDGPAIAVSAMTHAVTALNGASKIADEFRQNPKAATMGLLSELVPAAFEAFGR